MIYLDHNSSTPLASEAFEAMRPYLTEVHGNAASGHAAGRRLAAAVEEARASLASLVHSEPDEIVFTSGGTESNNWVFGAVEALHPDGGGIVVSAVEHFSVGEQARRLATRGFRLATLPVSAEGRVDPADLVTSLSADTRLVSIMVAQNEVGTVQPIAEIARLVREHAPGALVHADAAQAVGKIPVDFRALGVDLLSIAGHKLYGPKGIGALAIRRGVVLPSWMLGAPHEKGLRAGTLNVPGIVGLGAAARVAQEILPSEVGRLRELAATLFAELSSAAPGVFLNGPRLEDPARLPNTVNVSFPVLSYELLPRVPEVATTAGAACHSGDPRPSATLLALGLPRERALGAVRFSLGRSTTEADVRRAAALFGAALAEMRG